MTKYVIDYPSSTTHLYCTTNGAYDPVSIEAESKEQAMQKYADSLVLIGGKLQYPDTSKRSAFKVNKDDMGRIYGTSALCYNTKEELLAELTATEVKE